MTDWTVSVQDGDKGRLKWAEKGRTSLSENSNDMRKKKTVCSWRKMEPREGFCRLKAERQEYPWAGGKEASERKTVQRQKTGRWTKRSLV